MTIAPNRIWLAALLLILAAVNASCQHSPHVGAVEQAQRFVLALNDKNIEAMLAVAATPFVYRNQEWVSASDGSGFKLGAAADRVMKDRNALQSLFRELAATVHIGQPTPVENPPSKPDLVKRYLAGAEAEWSGLEMYVFLRGFGDVEHIAILGVDGKSKAVRALYLN